MISPTGYYHVVMRGVNRQNIFFDDQDRKCFLELLHKYQNQTKTKIVAYCLMNNHVHILLYSEELADFVKKVSASFVFRINKKYDRIGHLFQARYISKIIDKESYLLTATRYILRNPQRAGICSAEDYPWSSFSSLDGKGFCDIHLISTLAGGMEALVQFICTESEDDEENITTGESIDDSKVVNLIRQISGLENPYQIVNLPKKDLENILLQLRNYKISIRRISRITGISRRIIEKIK